MNAEAPVVTDEAVATPSPDAGKEVWCENGCGNRFLDHGERIPFPCPTGCGGMMTDVKPAVAEKKTKKVELPTLGRIVHVRLGANLWCPAVVLAADPDGTLRVHLFKRDTDPLPAGLGQGIVRYGTAQGQWQWPPREQKTEFLAEIDE